MYNVDFAVVLATKKCFDASGILNPADHNWYLQGNVFYPILK